MMRALFVEKCTILKGAQEVVRTLRTGRSVDCAHGIPPRSAIVTHKELCLLEIGEEAPKHTDRPPHRRRPRDMAVAKLKLRFPMGQEELEIGDSEVADRSRPKSVD